MSFGSAEKVFIFIKMMLQCLQLQQQKTVSHQNGGSVGSWRKDGLQKPIDSSLMLGL